MYLKKHGLKGKHYPKFDIYIIIYTYIYWRMKTAQLVLTTFLPGYTFTFMIFIKAYYIGKT